MAANLIPSLATCCQLMPPDSWKEATSIPCAAPATGPAVAAARGPLMTGPMAPAGPASWRSSWGEWVAPTLERFAGGPDAARPGPAAVMAVAVAGAPASPIVPRLATRAHMPADRRDT